MATLEEMKAAFLAKGGTVTQVPAATAYGIDPAADKAKRKAERDYSRIERYYSRMEHEAEIRQQRGVEENGYYKS